MTRGEIFDAIRNERKRQDKLRPLSNGFEHSLVVLAEQFGEVAKALYELENYIEKHGKLSDDGWWDAFDTLDAELAKELIQVAAVCVRWLEHR